MTYQVSDFTGQIVLNAMIHRANPNVATELSAISTALNADTSTHDTTIVTAPTGLQPGNVVNSRFTNDILLVVNAAKGGNLTGPQMSAAINAAIGQVVPPTNISPPQISGTGAVGNTLTNGTPGSWTPSGLTFTRQWLNDGAAIAGATGVSYVLQASDSGHNISVAVTGTNAAGTATANSNVIACA